jgi:phosphoglucomutase
MNQKSLSASGTEPKIKFYISVKEDLPSIDNYTEINEKLNNRILGNMRALKIDEGLPAIE